MSALRPTLLLLALATAAAGCDTAPGPEIDDFNASLRAAEGEIVVLETAGVAEASALALDADFEGHVVWTVHPPDPGEEVGDHPPDPGAVACVASVGREAFFVPSGPGVYVVRASVVDPESLEVAHTFETEVFVESEKFTDECVAAAIPDGILPSADEVSGIEPTPFHDDVSGVEPTPFEGDVSGIDPVPFYEAVAGIDPTPFYEDVAGVEPTPFDEGDVSGIQPTPFLSVLFQDASSSISAGCFCAYE